jgi:hypothetical protein
VDQQAESNQDSISISLLQDLIARINKNKQYLRTRDPNWNNPTVVSLYKKLNQAEILLEAYFFAMDQQPDEVRNAVRMLTQLYLSTVQALEHE